MSQAEREARRERLAALRAAGIDPYPARVGPREPIAALRARCDALDAAALEAQPQHAAVAGRVVALRSFGKLVFATLQEDGARIQISARKGSVDDALFDFVQQLDVGDFVRVEGSALAHQERRAHRRRARARPAGQGPAPAARRSGTACRTSRRASASATSTCSSTRTRAASRCCGAAIVTAMRAFLDARGFLEVETPVLQPIYGGAAARPFTTHHNAYDQQLYLRISDELYLKRLVVGGLDRVYEIGRVFRNEGVSRKHNPEFTMMECYQAYADYSDMMELTESMLQQIARTALGAHAHPAPGRARSSSAGPWPRVTLRDAILRATGVDVLARADLGIAALPRVRAGVCRRRRADLGPARRRAVRRARRADADPAVLHHRLPGRALATREALGRDPRLVERFERYWRHGDRATDLGSTTGFVMTRLARVS